MKFADDIELVGKVSNDDGALYHKLVGALSPVNHKGLYQGWYHKQIKKIVNWCDKNYLYLNVYKTKVMCYDFWKNQTCPKAVYIKGEAVERVETYYK